LDDPFADAFRQPLRPCRVEAKLDGRRDLVDVLSAGTGGADERLLEVIRGDDSLVGYGDGFVTSHGDRDGAASRKRKGPAYRASPIECSGRRDSGISPVTRPLPERAAPPRERYCPHVPRTWRNCR